MVQSRFARGLKGIVTGAGRIVARAAGVAPARPVQPARIPVSTTPGPWIPNMSKSGWVVAYRMAGPDLDVEYRGGVVCRYPGKAPLFWAMNAAPSKGKFVHAHLYHLKYVPL